MDLMFQKKDYSALVPVFAEIQNAEQTQEYKLPDGMPDIGKILGSWGQIIMRGKEWRSDRAVCTGGIMLWVLYLPEDGTEFRTLNSWCPFQMKWDLPDDVLEGMFSVYPLIRFVDVRSVSPRKIVFRCGIAALGEGFCKGEIETSVADQNACSTELLRKKEHFRIPKEFGEKAFSLEEDLTIDTVTGKLDKLLYYSVSPDISEQKVLANKIAFRGNANIHVLFSESDGRVRCQNYTISFSQFAELEKSFSSDAQLGIKLTITNLEMESDEAGTVHLKCGLLGQYLVDDLEPMEFVADAYSPEYNLETEYRTIMVPGVHQRYSEQMRCVAQLGLNIGEIVDYQIQADFPHMYQEDNVENVEESGTVQLLYYDENRKLCSVSSRWEGKMELEANSEWNRTVIPFINPEAKVSVGSGSVHVDAELRLAVTESGKKEINAITGCKTLEKKPVDPQKPTIILRRAENDSLWEIAKACSSSMDAIKSANNLQDLSPAGQILIIPVL